MKFQKKSNIETQLALLNSSNEIKKHPIRRILRQSQGNTLGFINELHYLDYLFKSLLGFRGLVGFELHTVQSISARDYNIA